MSQLVCVSFASGSNTVDHPSNLHVHAPQVLGALLGQRSRNTVGGYQGFAMVPRPLPEVPLKERACLQESLQVLKRLFEEVGYESSMLLALKPNSDPPTWLLQGRVERKRDLMYGELGQDKVNWDREATKWNLKSEDRMRRFSYGGEIHVAIAFVPGAAVKPLVGLNTSTGERFRFDADILVKSDRSPTASSRTK